MITAAIAWKAGRCRASAASTRAIIYDKGVLGQPKKALTQRLRGHSPGTLHPIDMALAEHILAALQGTTARAWPAAVYTMATSPSD